MIMPSSIHITKAEDLHPASEAPTAEPAAAESPPTEKRTNNLPHIIRAGMGVTSRSAIVNKSDKMCASRM